jgi:16S rRNA C1402 N4-methylase RsmH
MPANWPGANRQKTLGKMVYRKAVVPGEEEIAGNPSARSARLRVFEFA